MAARRPYKNGAFAQGGGFTNTGYTQQFTSPDVNIPMLSNNAMQVEVPRQEEPCRSFSLECVERKGKIGKLFLRENVGTGDKKPSDRAPKFKGEIRIGHYVFSVQVWPDKKGDGALSGPISIPN